MRPAYLRQRGLNVHALTERHEQPSPFFGGTLRTLRCTHGRGLIGLLMEHGVGYLIEIPGEPRFYLAGDTVLTPGIREFVASSQPDVCVVPAGDAQMDVGQDLIMGISDVLEFARLARGMVIANHLEALSHCPVTRQALKAAAESVDLAARLRIPADGETIDCP